MKQWIYMQVDHHEKVGPPIQGASKDGWRLHTYTTAGPGNSWSGSTVNHYLLFEKEG
jgi:hypothetical protein